MTQHDTKNHIFFWEFHSSFIMASGSECNCMIGFSILGSVPALVISNGLASCHSCHILSPLTHLYPHVSPDVDESVVPGTPLLLVVEAVQFTLLCRQRSCLLLLCSDCNGCWHPAAIS